MMRIFGLREISKMTGEQVHVKDGILELTSSQTHSNYHYIEQVSPSKTSRLVLIEEHFHKEGSHVETGESDKDNLARAPTPTC